MNLKPKLHEVERDITSHDDLGLYLQEHQYRIATNIESPAEVLLKASMPNWQEETQGCLIMFVPTTPGIPADISMEKPRLSLFIAGMCPPFCFVSRKSIAKGQKMLVRAA